MIFTFYSYKGGVGRSMALANVAEVLCRAGLRVLLVDWDLEAPGLEQYYPGLTINPAAQPGVIDLLLDYKAKAAGQWDETDGIPWLRPGDVVIDLFDSTAAGGGRLQLISAGRRDGDALQQYAGAVLGFDWANFYREWEGDAYFEWLRKELAVLADVVLIDSRTGVTEMGGVCTYQLADAVVLFCAGNRQNVDGTRQMAESFSRPELLELRRNRPLRLLVVPSRIDTSDSSAVAAFRRSFNESFAPFVPDVFEREEEFFFRLLIPYKPTYAFSENLALNQTDPASRDLTQAYLGLTDALSGLAPVAINVARLNRFKETISISPSVRLPLPRRSAVGPLPPGSRVLSAPNPLFVGREKEIEQILDNFARHGGPAVALSGIGGAGKTALAAEFAHRYGRYFAGGVSWISFANPDGIMAELAAAGQALGVAEPTTPLAAAVQATRQAWEENTPRLLIFNDCNDEALLAEWQPKVGGSRVLITSRVFSPSQRGSTIVIPIGTLRRHESVALLRAAAGRDFAAEDEKVLEAIAAELGDLPLAVYLAGHYMGGSKPTAPRQLLKQLRDPVLLESTLPVDRGFNASPHELNVSHVFALALERLKQGDATAVRLLARAAALAPGEPLPVSLLFAVLYISEELAAADDNPQPVAGEPAEEAPTAEQATATNAEAAAPWPPEFEDALKRLMVLGLLEPAGEWTAMLGDRSVRLHPMIAGLVARTLPEEMPPARASAEKLIYALLDENNETITSNEVQGIVLHLRHIVNVGLEREDETAADLAMRFAIFLLNGGDMAAARFYTEHSLPILEHVLGADHPQTAKILIILGVMLSRLGEFTAARPYLERAVAVRERALGPEHLDVAEALDYLGNLLLELGDLGAAQPYLEQALTIRERALGLEHPDVAASLDNLGSLMLRLGDSAEARPYLERALAIREQALGPDDPGLATGLNNLGNLLFSLGDLTAARPYLEHALTIRERALGSEHPDTATSLHNMGILLRELGDPTAARPYLERALAIRERVLGPDHPDTATSLNELAVVLQITSDAANTRPYLERALAIRERVLGPEHPDTAVSLYFLGIVLRAQGEVSVSTHYVRRAAAVFERVYGPEDELTLDAHQFLAERAMETGLEGLE